MNGNIFTMGIELIKFKKENITQLIKWIHSKEKLMQWAGPAYNFPCMQSELQRHSHL
jgi:hypothetical protein